MHLLALGPCVRTLLTFDFHLPLLTLTLPSRCVEVQGERQKCPRRDAIMKAINNSIQTTASVTSGPMCADTFDFWLAPPTLDFYFASPTHFVSVCKVKVKSVRKGLPPWKQATLQFNQMHLLPLGPCVRTLLTFTFHPQHELWGLYSVDTIKLWGFILVIQ